MSAVLLLCLLVKITLAANSATSIDDLKEFFKTTFLRKETGAYTLSGKKTIYAKGYNPSWSLYRFHHVCVRGGNDGIFVGIDGVKSVAPESLSTISPGEWNDLVGSRFNDPLTAFILENNPSVQLNPVFFRNSTIFSNCNRQHSLAYNPSLFMMKIGFIYELASCMLNNLGRHKVFKNDIILPFRYRFRLLSFYFSLILHMTLKQIFILFTVFLSDKYFYISALILRFLNGTGASRFGT
jgi:hypothetical protein